MVLFPTFRPQKSDSTSKSPSGHPSSLPYPPGSPGQTRHLVHECPPRQMGDALQLVVDEQLRQHEQEPERVHAVGRRLEQPGSARLR